VLDELAAAASGRIITRKAIAPTEQEVAANPRSRSAKLRVFQKAGGPEPETGSGVKAAGKGSSSRRHQRQERAGSKHARGGGSGIGDGASDS